MKTINDPSYELKGSERDIYEHSLLDAEVDKFMEIRKLRRKLMLLESEILDNDMEKQQPGETKGDLDFDYSNEQGK